MNTVQPMPSVEQVRQLTRYTQKTIPSDYLDHMGHMNIQFYFALYDAAATQMFIEFGMTSDYIKQENSGAFALEQHIRYLAEIHQGDRVSVYLRTVGQSAKRIHFVGYIVNDTHNRLASAFESVGSHANLALRRTSPFPPTLAAGISAKLGADNALAWASPLCGSMGA